MRTRTWYSVVLPLVVMGLSHCGSGDDDRSAPAAAQGAGSDSGPTLVLTGRTEPALCSEYANEYPDRGLPHAEGGDPSCVPGSMTAGGIEDSRRRLNWYRRWLGLPEVGQPDPTWNARAQQCAMMMGVAKDLSHHPGADWPCFTEEGATGASHSNISFARPTASFSIDTFIFDWGNEETMGHRRWLLLPGQQGLGYGFFDAGMVDGSGGGYFPRTGSCVVTFDEWIPQFDEAPDVPIVYPPAGAFPAALASFTNGEEPERLPWTITWHQADFESAKLLMHDQVTGEPIKMRQNAPFKQLAPNYGHNTAMWIPEPVARIGDRWAVRIEGIVLDGEEREPVEYEVEFVDCGATPVY